MTEKTKTQLAALYSFNAGMILMVIIDYFKV